MLDLGKADQPKQTSPVTRATSPQYKHPSIRLNLKLYSFLCHHETITCTDLITLAIYKQL